jgi:hypothetical protein
LSGLPGYAKMNGTALHPRRGPWLKWKLAGDRVSGSFKEAGVALQRGVTPEMVVDALVAADSYACAYQQESGRQPAAAAH